MRATAHGLTIVLVIGLLAAGCKPRPTLFLCAQWGNPAESLSKSYHIAYLSYGLTSGCSGYWDAAETRGFMCSKATRRTEVGVRTASIPLVSRMYVHGVKVLSSEVHLPQNAQISTTNFLWRQLLCRLHFGQDYSTSHHPLQLVICHQSTFWRLKKL